MKTPEWEMVNGDCCEELAKFDADSIRYSVFSPPFASLYTYTNSERDMGNCKGADEFFKHFDFLIPELFRVLMPGRNLSFHCMNLPTSKERDGVIGLRDFRGGLIAAFVKHGFIFHSEVCIWKDPVTAMQRTKALGLLNKQKNKDSCMSRQGIPDYLVTMRKPGINPEPVTHTDETFTIPRWQQYASPVWATLSAGEGGFLNAEAPNKDNPDKTGIDAGNTLQKMKEKDDERHICPLQLQVIERAVALWSNPGDTVLSPFAGIGSEGYQSILQGRKFIGIELKTAYYKQACINLGRAVEKSKASSKDLFHETSEPETVVEPKPKSAKRRALAGAGAI